MFATYSAKKTNNNTNVLPFLSHIIYIYILIFFCQIITLKRRMYCWKEKVEKTIIIPYLSLIYEMNQTKKILNFNV